MQNFFKVVGGLAVLGLVFIGLTAAVPANPQLCGPSNVTLECGNAGTTNGLVMGGPLSGADNNDLFFVQNGTELLEIEDSGSDVSFVSASGSILLSDAVTVTGALTLSSTVTVTGLVDGTTGGVAVGIGADPGATCTAGQVFIDTDEATDTNCTTTADNSLCICTAADTWTALENN